MTQMTQMTQVSISYARDSGGGVRLDRCDSLALARQ